MDLLELAVRVEALTAPDREVDAEIMFDLYAKPAGVMADGMPRGYLWPDDNPSWSFGIRFPGKDRAWFSRPFHRPNGETLLIERDGALVLMNDLRIPKLTASLDAAMSLVPESAMYRSGHDGEGADPELFMAQVIICNADMTYSGRSLAFTEPCARTAAALRALARQDGAASDRGGASDV